MKTMSKVILPSICDHLLCGYTTRSPFVYPSSVIPRKQGDETTLQFLASVRIEVEGILT
jgi:hypothetical protein